MPELITALTQASGLIEKGGIIGVLMIVIGVLAREIFRLRKTLVDTYAERDKQRLLAVRYKSALNNANITVDVSDILEMFAGAK